MHNPEVPETVEGWSLLHRMYRVRWPELSVLAAAEREHVAAEAEGVLRSPADAGDGATAVVQVLGHKADLMVIVARADFHALAAFEGAFARTRLHSVLEPTTSYVSIVELGMYDMTGKIHRELSGRGLQPGSEPFEHAFDETMRQQRDRVKSRLYCELPRSRHVCFYPMNKRRGESKNWYTVPFDERAAMMREHGMIGRHYSGQVTQIISGSIGLDDWEWGVDLFADDPLVFKKLIYEMRFDRASAEFAEFGPFYVGLQFAAAQLAHWLAGGVPALEG